MHLWDQAELVLEILMIRMIKTPLASNDRRRFVDQ
jgi:hypothetical protein